MEFVAKQSVVPAVGERLRVQRVVVPRGCFLLVLPCAFWGMLSTKTSVGVEYGCRRSAAEDIDENWRPVGLALAVVVVAKVAIMPGSRVRLAQMLPHSSPQTGRFAAT